MGVGNISGPGTVRLACATPEKHVSKLMRCFPVPAVASDPRVGESIGPLSRASRPVPRPAKARLGAPLGTPITANR